MNIKSKTGNKTLVTLVDTGASGLAFISESITKNLSLDLHSLSSPFLLTGFEGKKGPLVTHEINFSLQIGRHFEKINAFVTDSCKHDLTSGLPWLEKHNSFINWKNHILTFGEHCLINSCCQFETTVPYVNSANQIQQNEISEAKDYQSNLIPTIDSKLSSISMINASEFLVLS